MHRKFRLVFITFTLLLCSLPFTSEAQRTKVLNESPKVRLQDVDVDSPGSEPQVKGRVDFLTLTSVEAAVGAAQQQGVEVTEIRHNFYVGDQPFVGFYPVPNGSTSAEVRTGLGKAHRVFLQDMIRSAQQQRSKLKGKVIGDAVEVVQQESLEVMTANFREALTAAPYAEPNVTGITVKGRQRAIEGIKDSGPVVETIEIVPAHEPSELAIVSPSMSKDDTSSLSAASASWENWVPEQGVITTGQSDTKSRYINISMVWDDTSGFDANSTFEPDFFLNNDPKSNLGKGIYLDSRQFIDKVPLVEYSASNLPSPYLDTRLDDPSTEIAFTMGSAVAKNIRPYNSYYTYIRTRNGTASRDNAKFTAQLGYRRPSYTWCNTTWCSYGSKWERIISAWNIPVPGNTPFRK